MLIGSFQPWRREDTGQEAQAQLLNKGSRGRINWDSAPFASDAGIDRLRMNEKVVFRGTFVADSGSTSAHGTSSSASKHNVPHSTSEDSQFRAVDDLWAGQTDAHVPMSTENAVPENTQVLWLRSEEEQVPSWKPRDTEARGGSPGAPGGESC